MKIKEFMELLNQHGWETDWSDEDFAQIAKQTSHHDWVLVKSSWKHLYRNVARMLNDDKYKVEPGYGYCREVWRLATEWANLHYTQVPWLSLLNEVEEQQELLKELMILAKNNGIGTKGGMTYDTSRVLN